MRPMAETRDLIDGYGRRVKDLRISVTDRCNFRCTYCMPAEGMTWLPREQILTFEEIERIAGSASSASGSRGSGSPVASRPSGRTSSCWSSGWPASGSTWR